MPVWLPLVSVGLLGSQWEYTPLVGVPILFAYALYTRGARLALATLAYLVAALVGQPGYADLVAILAGFLLAAHDLHARRPGRWFVLLALGLGVLAVSAYDTGSGSFDYAPAVSFAEAGPHVVHPGVALLWALGLALAIWGGWHRDVVVVVTAALYLVVTIAHSATTSFTEDWSERAVHAAFHYDGAGLPFGAGRFPELVLLAGAVLAYTRPGRRRAPRPWALVAVAGLLGSLWEYGPLVALAVLLVAAGYLYSLPLGLAAAAYGIAVFVAPPGVDVMVAVAVAGLLVAREVNARRPGDWLPLAVVGATLFLSMTYTGVHRGWLTDGLPEVLPGESGGPALVIVGTLFLLGWAMYDRLALVGVVAVAYLTAGLYRFGDRQAGLQFLSQEQLRMLPAHGPLWVLGPELLILAGAAVAFARTGRTRPDVRTVGRPVGTPGPPPGP
ncbi:hypothetical protein GCM10022243_58740 [Saccharothrix violaceirubra]|uniref:Uncharacterized protein n=1 Tax=Saccharothrix violaceirubra TaxID=413306 RepID=A0A7W7T1Q3_9PSEU|nr:hypothetical protein [Saccharothrix violaceirubra]MBB4964911.1 hypothetical protein [Saccharothrix violaceirubra]